MVEDLLISVFSQQFVAHVAFSSSASLRRFMNPFSLENNNGHSGLSLANTVREGVVGIRHCQMAANAWDDVWASALSCWNSIPWHNFPRLFFFSAAQAIPIKSAYSRLLWWCCHIQDSQSVQFPQNTVVITLPADATTRHFVGVVRDINLFLTWTSFFYI